MTPYGDGTRCVRAGLPSPRPGQPFLPGPVFASAYHLDPAAGPMPGVDGYGRPDNATRRALEAAIGELEGGECVAVASGMAAVTAALLLLTRPGDTVLVPADGYYRTRSFAAEALPPRGVRVLTAPTAGPYPPLDGVRLVLLETPANPGLDVCDISALAARAHAAGALLAVDNTTATPLGQRPLDLGADLVVASGTKALAGHADLLLGYVCTRRPDLAAAIRDWRDTTGSIPGPFDCWLAHRSLATLDLRLARQTANAAALAALLANRPDVRSVRWPGLPTDPAYPLASRQMRRVPGCWRSNCRRVSTCGDSSRPPGSSPWPRPSVAPTPRPTGAPSGATTPPKGWYASPVAWRTPRIWSPTWPPRSMPPPATDHDRCSCRQRAVRPRARCRT